jgi:hypothetical protein
MACRFRSQTDHRTGRMQCLYCRLQRSFLGRQHCPSRKYLPTCILRKSKLTTYHQIRSKALIHNAISFIAPTVGLIAGLVGTSFFYGVNASNTTSSLQSWSCQWSAIDMNMKPHFRTLCKESKAALYLMVMMIPLQVIVMSTLAIGAIIEKKQQHVVVHESKGSPAMS